MSRLLDALPIPDSSCSALPSALIRRPATPRAMAWAGTCPQLVTHALVAVSSLAPRRSVCSGRALPKGIMSTTVAVPLWLAILIAALAAFALLDRLLVPSARCSAQPHEQGPR